MRCTVVGALAEAVWAQESEMLTKIRATLPDSGSGRGTTGPTPTPKDRANFFRKHVKNRLAIAQRVRAQSSKMCQKVLLRLVF